MSRAFGDLTAEQYGLIHTPDILMLDVPWVETLSRGIHLPASLAGAIHKTPWRWILVLGTDGLWDSVSVEDMAQELVGRVLMDAAQALGNGATMLLSCRDTNDDGSSIEGKKELFKCEEEARMRKGFISQFKDTVKQAVRVLRALSWNLSSISLVPLFLLGFRKNV